MSDDLLDEMERMLLEQLEEIQRSYQKTAAPIIKRLVGIRSLRPTSKWVMFADAMAQYGREASTTEGKQNEKESAVIEVMKPKPD